jgi:cysteinyl-tRNA synthetase
MRLHNTLSGQVEELRPLSAPEVGMYVCGLTVYGRGHIGNYRTLVATDLLRRTLRYNGYRVKEVMNITDVDDRIIKLAAEAKRTLGDFTAEHIRSFDEDMRTLRIERPDVVPRATDHIPEMIELIQKLIARGHTYTADGSVYFRISSFKEYGRLARLDVEGIQSGSRVDTDKYDKENARDFALWKLKSDEPEWAQWDAPFGRGRPGWHIECSAMGMKYLGETFDIHCGGIDLIFPHHENEIAQSSCGTGKPFVKHWFHAAHLLVDDATMSKSKGNFFTIPDVLEKGHRPDAIRYLYCQAHYRSQLNFTWEGLQHAAAALERIHGFATRLGEVERPGPVAPPIEEACQKAEKQFADALADDLNTPEALAAVHNLVRDGNSLLVSGDVTKDGAARLRQQLERMNDVFGVLLPDADERLTTEEQKLLEERQDARKKREFAKADEARKQLEALGVILEDTPKGTRWRRKR